MNSAKKRKNMIIDSDEEEDFNHSQALKSKSKNTKSKRKRIILSESEDDNEDQNHQISINDIKKAAKVRARKLATEQADDVETKKASTKKTPPSATKQKNNLFNYFKPLNADTNKNQEKQNKDEPIKTKMKHEYDEDGYLLTNIKNKRSSPPPKIPNIIESKIKSKSKTLLEDKQVYNKSEVIEKQKKNDLNKLDSKSVEKQYLKSPKKISPKKTEVVTVKKEKIQDYKEDSNLKKTLKSPKKILPRIEEPIRVSDLWVDKYKPSSIKQIIGQQGDRSSLNKLIKWLQNWHYNLDKKPYGKFSDDGAGFRAALLSGPPGIGKTTTAQLVCRELGYDYLEMNASDSRNKKALHEGTKVGELLKNTKLTDFFKPKSNNEEKLTSKHCVIMDEVDGVSGNADRGGIAEIIQLIKNTKVPIICICNDRGEQKIRSLVNYCFDLRFNKPKLEQIKSTLMSIAFKENVRVSQDVINDLIVSSNYDIRQCIHNLYLLSITKTNVQKMINEKDKIKDVRLSTFEAIRKVFCPDAEFSSMTLNDRSDLFFCDYSFMPLFAYENYASVNLSSKEPKAYKQMKRLYQSIDSISQSDLVEKEIRTNQTWSLLSLQALFSTVIPSYCIRSANGLHYPQFPQFLGKLSTTNKNNRIIEELVSHMNLSISGSKTTLALDYIEPIRNIIIENMKFVDKSGISTIIDLLNYYSLNKNDMDSILDYCLWAGDDDPMKKIDSKIKAAVTRAYNSNQISLPYSQDGDFKLISRGGEKNKKKGKKKNDFLDSDKSDDEQNDDEESIFGMDVY